MVNQNTFDDVTQGTHNVSGLLFNYAAIAVSDDLYPLKQSVKCKMKNNLC